MNRKRQRLLGLTCGLATGMLILQGWQCLIPAQTARYPLSGLTNNAARATSARNFRQENSIHADVWQSVRANLFVRPDAPPPPLPVTRVPVALPVSPPPVSSVLPNAPVPDPLAEYVYCGTVTADGVTSALIEHRKSKQGWYVEAGETWQNFQIVAVDAREITLMVDGQKRTLARSEAMNLTPLQEDGQRVAEATGESTVSTDVTPLGVEEMAVQLSEDGIWWRNISVGTELTPEEIKRIKDDVFERRLSPEEGERKLKAGQATTLRISLTPTIIFDSMYIPTY